MMMYCSERQKGHLFTGTKGSLPLHAAQAQSRGFNRSTNLGSSWRRSITPSSATRSSVAPESRAVSETPFSIEKSPKLSTTLSQSEAAVEANQRLENLRLVDHEIQRYEGDGIVDHDANDALDLIQFWDVCASSVLAF